MMKKSRRAVLTGKAVVSKDIKFQNLLNRFLAVDPSLTNVMDEDTFRFFLKNGKITFEEDRIRYLFEPLVKYLRHASYANGTGHLSHGSIRQYPQMVCAAPKGQMVVSIKRPRMYGEVQTYEMFYGDKYDISLYTFTVLINHLEPDTPINDLPPEIAFLYWGLHSTSFLDVKLDGPIVRANSDQNIINDRFLQIYCDPKLPGSTQIRFEAHFTGARPPSRAKDTVIPFEWYIPALTVARCCLFDPMVLDSYNFCWTMMNDVATANEERTLLTSIFSPDHPFTAEELDICRYAYFAVMYEVEKAKNMRTSFYLGSCSTHDYDVVICKALPAQSAAVGRLVYSTAQGCTSDAVFIKCPVASTEGIEMMMVDLSDAITPYLNVVPPIDEVDEMWYFVSSIGSSSGVFVHRDMVDLVHLGQFFMLYIHRMNMQAFTTPPFALIARLILDFSEKTDMLEGSVTSVAHMMLLTMMMRNAGFTVRSKRPVSVMTFDHGRGQLVERFLRLLPHIIVRLLGLSHVSRIGGDQLFQTATMALDALFNSDKALTLFKLFKLFTTDPTDKNPFTFDATHLRVYIDDSWTLSEDLNRVIFTDIPKLAYFLHFLMMRRDELDLDIICDIFISCTVDDPEKQNDEKLVLHNKRIHSNVAFLGDYPSAIKFSPIEIAPGLNYVASSAKEKSVKDFGGFLTVLCLAFEMYGSRETCPCEQCPLYNYSIHGAIPRANEYVIYQSPLTPVYYGGFFMSRRDVPFFGASFPLISHLCTHYKRTVKTKDAVMK